MVRLIALMYHALADSPAGKYGVAFRDFRKQIGWLVAEGYIIEGFPELQQRLASADFPERYVVLTVDDGHTSGLPAAQFLREMGAQATFFLTKRYCRERRDFLNEREILELGQLCSIGSHGVTHRALSRLNVQQARRELCESRSWLEDILGQSITAFSAPGGFLNAQVVEQAIHAGYTLLGSSVEWWNRPDRVCETRVVYRTAVRPSFTFKTFQRIARAEAPFFLRRRTRAAALEIPKRLRWQARASRPALA
jgi:peptidoglycan/xylan/chitin deacetylase (PgdA/CDA1 family)